MMALLSDPCLTFNCVHISRSFTGSLVTRVSYLQLCTRLLQFLEVLSNSVSYLQRCTRVLQFLKVLDDGDFILPPHVLPVTVHTSPQRRAKVFDDT